MRVEAFPRLESFATVHHLVADVVADVAPGRDAFDLLAALFPGGSITGAPKLASMAAIAELEGEGRGFFTGSAGFVDTRGRAAFDILIRTLVWRRDEGGGRGTASYHVGGGITWSSDAAAEDRETLEGRGARSRARSGGVSPAGSVPSRRDRVPAAPRLQEAARSPASRRAGFAFAGKENALRASTFALDVVRALAARPRACGNGGKGFPPRARVRAIRSG